jgi:hypothetical protein
MHGCHILRTGHPPDPLTDAEPQHSSPLPPLKRKRTQQPSEASRASSPERAAQAQVQGLKAELAKARADAAAAIALAAEREPHGFGGSVDRLFSSRTCAAPRYCADGCLAHLAFICRFGRACGAAPPRRVACEPKQGSAQGDGCGVCKR